MPEAVLRELRSEYNYVPSKVKTGDLKYMMGEVDVLYLAPVKPYTYPLGRDFDTASSVKLTDREMLGKTDVIYVTRLQTERMGTPGDIESAGSGSIVTRELLGEFKKRPLVMHPLPRVNELPSELDNYPRSVYFQEAAYGVPIRMALTALLLGASPIKVPQKADSSLRKTAYTPHEEVFDVQWPNANCVSNHERERRDISPKFHMIKGEPLMLRCVYCDYETHPPYIASSKWHQGILENKRYYSSDSFMLERIKPENLIIFGSESEAMAQGFSPGQYAHISAKRR